MLEKNNIQQFLFVGIGGIGMSALARFFHEKGYVVIGYDRTPSPLTRELEQEGLRITYADRVDGDALVMPDGACPIGDVSSTQVVLTPAVPESSVLLTYLRQKGYDIEKRSAVLGLVTRQMKALCVAGTHGKTTTSTLMAHLLYQSEVGTNAFLGGISENYHTNVLTNKSSNYVVIEADEYDRSFHRLTPYMTVITSCDPDHLDIYGTAEAYREAFEEYISLVSGAVLLKQGLPLQVRLKPGARLYTYGVANPATMVNGQWSDGQCPDFYADHIEVEGGKMYFDFHTPGETISHMRLGVPVWVNIENGVAAMAIAWLNGVSATELRTGLASFSGVYRRFNIHVNTPKVAYIDDYAHHPMELKASIESVRRLYPERYLIGVFQPHLYSRTRDFAPEFASVLSMLDEVILLPIYAARELPIAGVTSGLLLADITAERQLVEKDEVVPYVQRRLAEIDKPVAVLSLGAGDIDRLVPELAERIGAKQ